MAGILKYLQFGGTKSRQVCIFAVHQAQRNCWREELLYEFEQCHIGHLLLAVSGVQVKHLNPEEFTPGPRCSRRCMCGLVLAAGGPSNREQLRSTAAHPEQCKGGVVLVELLGECERCQDTAYLFPDSVREGAAHRQSAQHTVPAWIPGAFGACHSFEPC